jgi:hypothetical protein
VVATKRQGYSEGPFLFKRSRIYYYFYTLGAYENYEYAYMMSRVSPLGPWTAPDDDVLMKTNHATKIYGPGHGSVFRDSKTDRWYFAYLEYGRGGASRQVFVEQMNFHADCTIQPLKLTGAGVGALRPPLVAEKNLSLGAHATASSFRPTVSIPGKYDPAFARTESFSPENAVDGSNGSRWSFDPKGVGYTVDRLPALYREIEDRFAALPGMANVSLVQYIPLGGNMWGSCVIPQGHPAPGPNDPCFAAWDRASSHFLDSIGGANSAWAQFFHAGHCDVAASRFSQSGLRQTLFPLSGSRRQTFWCWLDSILRRLRNRRSVCGFQDDRSASRAEAALLSSDVSAVPRIQRVRSRRCGKEIHVSQLHHSRLHPGMMLRGAFWQLLIGLAIGIPAALIAGHFMASLLYEVKPYDPLAFLGAILLLAICAIVAGFIPARRAASIDPMQALRTD